MAGATAGSPSKKERVVTLARRDPFLRIEEIARRVGTTAPYVRTVLSDAQLSLADLRKAYARQMEARLGSLDAADGFADSFPLDHMMKAAAVSQADAMPLDGAHAEEMRRILGVGAYRSLIAVSRAARSQDGVAFVNRLITDEALYRDPTTWDRRRSFGSQLAKDGERRAWSPGACEILIVRSDANVASQVRRRPGDPCLALRWMIEGVPRGSAAMEEFLFDADAVSIVWRPETAAFTIRPRPQGHDPGVLEGGRLEM